MAEDLLVSVLVVVFDTVTVSTPVGVTVAVCVVVPEVVVCVCVVVPDVEVVCCVVVPEVVVCVCVVVPDVCVVVG